MSLKEINSIFNSNGNTVIYYALPQKDVRKSWFGWQIGLKLGEITLPTNLNELRKTHRKLANTNETNKDKIFFMLQAMNWGNAKITNPFIKDKGLHHTSMSVGDVIYFKDKKKAWIVKDVGWKKLW